MQLTWNDARISADGSRLAAAWRELGLGPGHRLAVLTGNTPLHVQAHDAARLTGVGLVPFNTRRPPMDLAQALAWTPWDAVLCDPGSLAVAQRHLAGRPLLEASVRGEVLQVLPAAPGHTPPPAPLQPSPTPETAGAAQTPALWLETSGTSGAPRRVGVTRAMLDAHAAACTHRLGDGPDAVWFGLLPLHHVGGVALVDRGLRNGSTLVLEERFDVERVATRLAAESATHTSLVPTMLRRLLEAKARAPPSLRCVLLGGDATPDTLVRQAIGEGWPVHCTYGLTEACSQVATATPAERLARPGTSGRALPGVHVSIAQGEVVVAGPTVAGGGPLRTGDLGHLDADGYLTVTGRVRDLVVTGGEKVLPRDVERAIEQHPAVAAACIVGLPDERWGQRVAAAVVLRRPVPDAELAEHCRQRLAPHQVPKEWRRLDAMPRTDSGKLRRAAVREAWVQATVPT